MDKQKVVYGWQSLDISALLWHSISVEGDAFWNSFTNQPETVELGTMWKATTKPGATLEAYFIWFYEQVPFNFPVLQRALITQGSYTFARASAAYQMASSKLYRTHYQLDERTCYVG